MITGSIVAHGDAVQPGSLAVDWPALRRLVDWHIDQGTDATVAVGTTGESATLDVSEHLEVIRVCVEQAGGRVPIVAGTGANSTSEAVELTAGAKARRQCLPAGVPYYNKPTQEGLYRHFRALAEEVDIPQICTTCRRGPPATCCRTRSRASRL